MRQLVKLSIPTIAASLLLAACGSGSSSNTTSSSAGAQSSAQTSSAASSAVIKTASNATLGTILVDGQGMTLYHLSGEHAGKFICTSSACLAVWHPMLAPAGGAPSGVGSLGTVTRSDGTVQVTYKGTPLYTFAQDKQPGEATGQGIKDVGTWSVVKTSSTSPPAGASGTPGTSTPTPTPAPTSTQAPENGGGYSY
jgi:predicted lipoprotein with Yx(FWY)xxD motif